MVFVSGRSGSRPALHGLSRLTTGPRKLRFRGGFVLRSWKKRPSLSRRAWNSRRKASGHPMRGVEGAGAYRIGHPLAK